MELGKCLWLKKLIVTYAVALLLCTILATVGGSSFPVGLSITMSTAMSAMYSTMLGSMFTTLSSSMILASESFEQAFSINQLVLPLIASIVLCFAELARSTYGRVSERLERVSQSMMSHAVHLTLLCLVFLIITLYYCVRGVF